MMEYLTFDFFIHSLESFQQYFATNPLQGVLMSSAFAFIESLAIIGSFIPGIVLMSVVGFLIGSGTIPLIATTSAVLVGAFAGDYISYLVGKYYRQQIISSALYKNNLNKWSYGEKILNSNGVSGMVLGRLIGPVRSTMPLIAGLIDMPLSTFIMGAIGSVLVWSVCYITPSFLLAMYAQSMSMDIVGSMVKSMLSYVLHACVCIILTVTYVQYRAKPNEQSLKPYLLEMLILTISLSYIILLLSFNSDVLVINEIILRKLQSWQTYPLIYLSTFISIAADKYTLYGFCTLASAYLLLRKSYWSALLFAFSTYGVGFAIKFVKIVIDYPRPEMMLNLLGPTAFPSGHTGLYYTIAAALCAMLGFSSPKYRKISFSIAIFSTILVMLSRLYLGAHWLTDVIGGLIIGQLFYIGGYALVYTNMIKMDHSKSVAKQLIIGFVMICIIVPVARLTNEELTFHYDPKLYLLENRKHVVKEPQWQSSTPHFMLFANNTLGIPSYPLNIQIESELSTIAHELNEWQSTDYFYKLSPVFLGRKPDLILKNNNNPNLYIALWSCDRLLDNGLPLTVGVVSEFSPSKNGLVILKDFNQTEKVKIKGISRTQYEHKANLPLNARLEHWDGKILKFIQDAE